MIIKLKKSLFFLFSFFFYCCLLGQEKDILEVARVPIPSYNHFEFSPNGEFAYGSNAEDRTLSLIQTKTAQILKVLPFDNEGLENIYISPNSQLMLTTNKNNITLWSVDSAKYLFNFLKNGARHLSISPDSRYYATVSTNNAFDIVDLLTREGVSYTVPNYIEGKGYKSNIERCIFSKMYNKLYLVDIGFAEEMTTYKSGLHINIIPFDLEQRKLLKPIELFISNAKNFSADDFTEISNTPNGRFIIVSMKNKIIYYDIVTKIKKEVENIEVVKKITYDSSGNYILTSGLNTTTLWEITPSNIFRPLKKFIGGSTTLSFTPDKKYIITLTPNKTHLIAWDIKEALLIRTNPSIYIQRSSQKYSKLSYIEWLKPKKGENGKKYLDRMKQSNKEKNRNLILNDAISKFCREVFGLGADYLIINKDAHSDEVIKIQTDGFLPLNFNVIDSAEHAKFTKYFIGGFYRWSNLEFKINKNEVIISRAVLHMNYNKTYLYKIEDDAESNSLLDNIYKIEYSDYDLENEKIKQ